MSDWASLVATALIGVERAAPPEGGEGATALGALLARLGGAPAGRRLLASAATLSTWRRAGIKPLSPPMTPPAPAPADDPPPCPPAAEEHLARMLQDKALAPLLPEWLGALAAAGWSLPHRWLPELLDLACRDGALRPLIRPALGARGRWLAAQHASWAHLLLPAERQAILAAWQTAEFADRAELLYAVRRTDPALGRELVASTWAQEPAREREAFLKRLGAGLSLDDEPFLEAALDDHAKVVRLAAAAALAALPGSTLCARMRARVEPLLRYRPAQRPRLAALGLGRPAAIAVALPETCDAAMLRDGIEAKGSAILGQRSGWLNQMLSLISPATWAEQWGASASEIVAAVDDENWDVLITGWAYAAARYRDASWAEALARRLLARRDEAARAAATLPRSLADLDHLYVLVELLWPALPRERQEALALEALRADDDPLADGRPALRLLGYCRPIWSEALGRATLVRIRQRLHATYSILDPFRQLRGALRGYSQAMPPSLAAEAADGWDRQSLGWTYWGAAVEDMLTILQFRHDMLAAIALSPLARACPPPPTVL